jgi:uncharacterized integral membrane protein
MPKSTTQASVGIAPMRRLDADEHRVVAVQASAAPRPAMKGVRAASAKPGSRDQPTPGAPMASHPDRQTPDDKGAGRLIVAGIIVLVVILFALFNRERVEVDWILFERSSRLIYVIIGSALLGALVDRLLVRRGRREDE